MCFEEANGPGVDSGSGKGFRVAGLVVVVLSEVPL